MAPSNLIAALEELAMRRQQLVDAIITIARVQGVDPAPYLGGPPDTITSASGVVYALTGNNLPLADRLKEAAKAMRGGEPPRPQSPASPATNGTGRAQKVERSRGQEILALLKSHGRGAPVRPGVISKAMKVTPETLRRHLDPLIRAGQVKVDGKTSGRTIVLA